MQLDSYIPAPWLASSWLLGGAVVAVGSTVTFGSTVAVGSTGTLVGVGLGGPGVFVGTGVWIGADVGVGRVGVTVAIAVRVPVGTAAADGAVVGVGPALAAGFGVATAVGVGVSVGMTETVGATETGVSGMGASVGGDVGVTGVGEVATASSLVGVTLLLLASVRSSPPSLQATTRISTSESAINVVTERPSIKNDRAPIRNGRTRQYLIAKSSISS